MRQELQRCYKPLYLLQLVELVVLVMILTMREPWRQLSVRNYILIGKLVLNRKLLCELAEY